MADPLLAALLADANDLADSSATSVPSSVTTLRTGGVLGDLQLSGTSTSKLFTVVKVHCSDDQVCFGRIGTGSAFCIRRNCSVKAHVDSKVPFYGTTSSEYVFICQTGGLSAYVEPSVSESKIPEDVWKVWETKSLPLSEWRREFQAVEATDDKFASAEEIKKEFIFLDSAEAFKTPGKRKRNPEGEEEGSQPKIGEVKIMRYDRVLPEEREELERIVLLGGMKKGVLTSVVSGLETNAIRVSETLVDFTNVTSSRFQSHEDTMSLVSGVINNLRSGIGSPVELVSDFVAPTMWGTLSILADEVLRVGGLLNNAVESFGPFRTSVSARLEDYKANGDALTKIVSVIMKSIKGLTIENQSLRSKVDELVLRVSTENLRNQHGSRGNTDSTSTRPRSETVEDLMSMMLNNTITPEGATKESAAGVHAEVNGASIDEDLSLRHPILATGNFDKFLQLIEDVGILKISAEATAIKFGGLGLRNLQECTRWVETNFTGSRYGLVIDPLTLLDRIFGDDEVDPMTQLKTLESRLKLNIKTGAESAAITSLGHSRPRIFHCGRPTMTCDQKTSRLNKLCKPARWKTGGEGVRNYIIKQMNVLQSSIGSDIMYAFGNHIENTKAQMIATLSLTASVAFVTQLLNYIDALFEKLHVYSKFTVETAWSLTMQVLDRIVADLYVPKEGVGNGMQGDRNSICAHVLWSSFKTLDVAQVYLDHNFENHPAISSEFIKFLATNSGFEKVEQLDTVVTTLKGTVATALTDSKHAAAKSDTASAKCSELNGLITALTRRIKTLEDRGSRPSKLRLSEVSSHTKSDPIVLPSSPITADRCDTKRTSSPTQTQPPKAIVSTPSIKEIKRGFKSFREPQVCGVSFERLPAWLWTLRGIEWSIILLSKPDNDRIRQFHPDLYERLKNKLRTVNLPFGSSSMACEATVWWISGGIEFANSLGLPAVIPKVTWVTGLSRRFIADKGADTYQWLNVPHSKVGGSTTSRGRFRIGGLSDEVIIPQDLTRNIGHILKYSIRPKACPVDFLGPHYHVNSKLSIHQLEKPVVMPSTFSATGWGSRALTLCELETAFELPEYVRWDPAFATQLIPLQILRSVMDAVIGIQTPSEQPRMQHRRTRSETGMNLTVDDQTWLVSLGRWLPGSWSEGEISDKAVKSDDAVVNIYPWYRRISLIFTCDTQTFHRLGSFAMRRWRRNIIYSFFAYLRTQYGRKWKSLLTDPSNKRKRAVTPTVESNVFSEIRGVRGQDRSGYLVSSCRTELIIDLKKGLAIIGQVLLSSWWDWSNGSSLFFWRWNGNEQIKASRDGMRIFVRGPLPSAKRIKPLRLPSDQLPLVLTKIETMTRKGYLSTGPVKSCLHFFAVPKGPTDVRVVYDGTSCGLNESLWAPNFYLPSSRAASLLMTFSSWLADADFGEMFHNFFMDPSIRKHSGVDTSKLKSNSSPLPILRWTRLFMGMKSSPYNAVRHYYWGEEFARGNPRRDGNPMGYDKLVLNLPGYAAYDPCLPKVMKWNSRANEGVGSVAGDIITFVDDVRIVGFSKENCHDVHRQFTSRMQFLGIQDAPRKFRPPSQSGAGAWTGTIFRVSPTSISKSVSVEKWTKGLAILSTLQSKCLGHNSKRPELDRKQLERDTGFLNHLAMTFEETTPFLKGFYLTLNSWRPMRDEDDWKLTEKSWNKLMYARMERDSWSTHNPDTCPEELPHSEEAPSMVVASPRLSSDVNALLSLLGGSAPPVTQLRSLNIVSVVFGFGDASGTGLGATFTCGDSGFTYRIGVWGSLEQDESSNWKEFSNVVESLEEEAESGRLAQSEVFMFTDNATVEACSFKGSSSSQKLLSLIIRLKAMSTKQGIRLHIFHVAGTRMIAQGTDGVSRGFLAQGVMAGEAMTAFIPIHQSATERSSQLLLWLQSWCGKEGILLTPDGWFNSGHDIEGWTTSSDGFERPKLAEGRTYIWGPPPYAADVAIAELRKARIKRQSSSHIFVCPRLCCSLWMKQLYRASDFVFQVLPDSTRGSSAEPLKCSRWEGNCEVCQRSRKWTEGIFCANFGRNVMGFNLCRRMWCGRCYSSSENLPFHVADLGDTNGEADDEDRITSGWKQKRVDPHRYLCARNGDDLMVSFECDVCIFAKLYKRLPFTGETNEKDEFALACVRRITLDAFWSRARSTVTSNTYLMRSVLKESIEAFGLADGPCSDPGPLPNYDHCGYQVAMQMVAASLKGGRYSSTHKQWDTIRRVRSVFSNQFKASAIANSHTLALADNKGSNSQRLSQDPCGSIWFHRFSEGCRRRMGQDWRPNRAISVGLMKELLNSVEQRIVDSSIMKEKYKWLMAGGYFCFCFVVSLRSPEGLLCDLEGVLDHFDDTRSYVIIPLLGQVKGEHHSRQHLLPCVEETDSGIKVKVWMKRVMAVHAINGRTKGPLFVNGEGAQSSTSELNDLFQELLIEIFEIKRDLFDVDIRSPVDIQEKYNVFRSFRRGSESRAVSKGVSEADRYVVHRWKRKEASGNNKVSHPIDQLYVDISLVKDSFLRYTQAM